MLLPCCCHAVAMQLPCSCHADATLLPCTRPFNSLGVEAPASTPLSTGYLVEGARGPLPFGSSLPPRGARCCHALALGSPTAAVTNRQDFCGSVSDGTARGWRRKRSSGTARSSADTRRAACAIESACIEAAGWAIRREWPGSLRAPRPARRWVRAPTGCGYRW